MGCEILVFLGLAALTFGLVVLGYIAYGIFLFIFCSVLFVAMIWEMIIDDNIPNRRLALGRRPT